MSLRFAKGTVGCTPLRWEDPGMHPPPPMGRILVALPITVEGPMPHAGPRSRPFVCLAVMLAITASPVAAQATVDTSLAARLVGSWTVDLRPTPDAPAYDKEFVIETVTGRDFTGRFYDTPIENGKI